MQEITVNVTCINQTPVNYKHKKLVPMRFYLDRFLCISCLWILFVIEKNNLNFKIYRKDDRKILILFQHLIVTKIYSAEIVNLG